MTILNPKILNTKETIPRALAVFSFLSISSPHHLGLAMPSFNSTIHNNAVIIIISNSRTFDRLNICFEFNL
ncbi:MAG: hypothetical protein UD961_00545, partial [Bacteroidales bacterium]|nr:hypothetical protein [Bacteroidales bacterium]